LPAETRWWQLASDGSYVVAASDTHLTVWSAAGVALFTRLADYGDAQVFAAAEELRIGAGPAGAQVIETISVPAGIASVGDPYLGAFQSWSEDGGNFIVKLGGVDSEVFLQPALPQAHVQSQH